MEELDKIIGYKSIKVELARICDILINFDKYEKLGVKKPRGLLLHGDPGVGKTLMAQCVIEATKLKCFTCRKNLPDGDFVKEIKSKFIDAVKSEPAIVFLDDMDKFANGDKMHRDCEEYVTVQSCIDNYKDRDIFVIATVNDIYDVPRSLVRDGRFDCVIRVNSPVGEDAKQIIDFYLKQKKLDSGVDSEEVARMLNGYSCATLENVINQAGIYAGFAGKDRIDHEDIVKSCLRIIYEAPESLDENTEAFKKEVAYHEAGHAVVAELLEPGSVSIVNITKHESHTAGITGYYQDESYWHSKKKMENRVRAILAGKASTELVFGENADVGANSDIHRAIDVVERFVDNYCGFGFNKFEFGNHSSNDLLARKENNVFDEMERYYSEAKKILVENRDFLDAVANALFEKLTLTQKDIKAIRAKLNK